MHRKRASISRSDKPRTQIFDLNELVLIIGYRLAAYIGNTDIKSVSGWLENGLPEDLEARMRAALEVVQPIAKAESELVAQSFLIQSRNNLEPHRFPAAMLRDAPVSIARDVLVRLARKEFLVNVASDLEAVAERLERWITKIRMPERMAYIVHQSPDRLSISLLHSGYSIERQSSWDRGEEWPFWAEMVAEVPEMAVARVSQDIDTGLPFRYLRRSTY